MAQLINGTTIAGHTAIHAGNLAAHSIATTSYVTTQISNLINGAPGALDTLNELAAALGNDASFSSTITNSLAAKLALSGGTMAGNINWAQTDRGLTWGMNTDGAYIKFFNTGDGDADSRLEYSTSDNGDEYHRWMISGTEKMTLKGDGLRVANTIYASGGNSGNWNTAYGWGNHASAGYLTGITSGQVTSALGYTPYNSTNPNGYITGITSGMVTSALGYTPYNSSNPSGYLSSVSIDNITDEHRLFNNMGEGHSTRTSFDASTPSYNFGFRFIQGLTNGPAAGGGNQFYSWYLGLGDQYPATGAGSYGMHVAIPRTATTPYMSVRYNENNSLGSWIKIAAGYADTAGALSSMNISQFTNNSGYLTGITSGQVTTALGYTPYNSTNPNGYITGITSGMVTTALGYTPANSSHNHDGVYVRAYTTTNDNIDSDWGQSFKTFDPVPSGTPPISSPNLRTINIGENFSRRTQLAFNYATDQAWFRRNQDGTWYSWREFFHTGNFTDNSSNWNTAYNKRPTAISFSGTSTKTLTLTQGDGSTLTASFSDIDTDTNTDAQTLSLSGNVLSISGGNSVTLSSSGLSQATADSLYVAKAGGSTVAGITYFSNGESMQLYGIRGRYSGDGMHLYGKVDIGNPNGWGAGIGNTPSFGLSTYGGAYFAYNQGTVSVGALGTAKLHVIGNTSGQELFAVDGVNGRLFSVVDDLSDSLYSVNTIAGLPVLEVFANNIVTIGKFGTNAIYVGQDGRVGFGTTDFSYTAADQTSPTNNRLFVNGSIQLLGNNDAIVFGRGTATVLRDEKLAFGWGSGWYMEDSSYLRVVGSATIYTPYSARFDDSLYLGGATYRLYSANSGLWTNGNLGASGDLYLGTRSTWLSSWLNQSVQTGADPTFNSVYLANGNLRLYQGDGTALRVVTAYGWMNLGAQNGSWTHMYASLDFYFNRNLYVNGTQVVTNSGTWSINVSGSAGSVAWTNVSGRPTALSSFTNDLGNYGGWITSSGSISGNAATATAAQGATFTTQGNSTWGGRLQIGGNGSGSGVATIAVVQATDGNLHMDNGLGKSMYLNYYHNGTIYLNGGTYSISSNGSYYNGTAASANSVAWTNVSSRPTALSQFSNDLGNYGGWITSSGSISGTAARATRANGNFYIDDNYGNTVVGVYASTRLQGVFAMGDSYKLPADGSSSGSLYGMAWSHPNAGGVAGNLNTHGLLVMENGTFLAAISGSIRARDDMRAPALYDSGSRVAISRGEGRNYVDYSRYVYNNGAYSGSGWIEPSDLGVRYANSAGSLSNMNISQFSNNSGYITASANVASSDRLYPFGAAIDSTHPGYGLRAWYDWAYSGTYRNGISLGSNPGDQAYGWQLWQNMWDDRTYTRRYNSGWQTTRTLMTTQDDPYAANMNQYVRTSDSVSFSSISSGAIYSNNWFRAYGDTGLYLQDYGGHFRRNTNSSHGTFEIFGYAKGGYNGLLIKDDAGYFNNYMHEGGNGGLYCENQGGRWPWYWHRGNTCLGLGNSTTSSSYRVYVNGSLYAEGDIVAYSDARKKTDIITIDNALDKVLQLRGVYYTRIDETEKGRQTGVIAQEINEVLPEVVTYAQDVDEYGVKYGNIAGILIEAVKEQQKQIAELKEEIKKLRGE